jgi:hypothetical protein
MEDLMGLCKLYKNHFVENLGETLEKHYAGKTTKKRQNSESPTPPACAWHPHSMLNGETRRVPVLPDASSYWLERSKPPGELRGMWYSHKQPWARSA